MTDYTELCKRLRLKKVAYSNDKYPYAYTCNNNVDGDEAALAIEALQAEQTSIWHAQQYCNIVGHEVIIGAFRYTPEQFKITDDPQF